MVMLTLRVSHFNGLLVLNARAVSTHRPYYSACFWCMLRRPFALARSFASPLCTLPVLWSRHFGRGRHGERTKLPTSALCTFTSMTSFYLPPLPTPGYSLPLLRSR